LPVVWTVEAVHWVGVCTSAPVRAGDLGVGELLPAVGRAPGARHFRPYGRSCADNGRAACNFRPYGRSCADYGRNPCNFRPYGRLCAAGWPPEVLYRPPRSRARWVPRGRIGFGSLSWLSWLRSMSAWPIRATVLLAEPGTTGCPAGPSPLEVVNAYTGW